MTRIRLLLSTVIAIFRGVPNKPTVRRQMSQLAAVRHGLRRIGHLITWLLLLSFACATANATSPCYQWIGGTAGFGLLGSPRNDPATAFNDVVTICNSNNFCYENNGTATCGNGFSCCEYPLSMSFRTFNGVI